MFPNCDAGEYFTTTALDRKHFMARFNSNTRLTWSTKIGDNSPLGSGQSRAKLAIADEGVLLHATTYYTGTHTPPLTPTIYSNSFHQDFHMDQGNNGSDSYVGLFDPGTNLLYGTYFGGMGNESAHGITAVDSRIYICGQTFSLLNFPTHAPTIPDHSPYLNDVPQSFNTSGDGFIAQLRHDFTIGVEDKESTMQNGITLYPNPTNGSLRFSFEGNGYATQVVIFDAVGKLVFSESFQNQTSGTLELKTLAPGVYSLSVFSPEAILGTTRFIKQ